LTRSLKDYALVAEIIGAIAVVISLIYVGLSVNQNTNAVMVANHQALVAMDQNTNDWLQPWRRQGSLRPDIGIDVKWGGKEVESSLHRATGAIIRCNPGNQE